MGVLVLERAGQVVVDLVEAQRQRLGRSGRPGDVRAGRAIASNAARRSAGVGAARPGARDAGRRRQVEGLEHERRDAARPGSAVVRGVREDQLVAGAGHRHVEQPSLLGERELRRRRQRRDPDRPAAPAPRPVRSSGNRPATSPGRNTTGNSRPFALWTVRTATASASGSSSAVAGSSPASMSVCEMRRDEDRPVVGQQRRLAADDLEEPRDVAGALPRRRACRWPASLRQQPARAQEPVQQLAGRPLVGDLRVADAGRRRASWTAARVSGPTRRIPGCASSSSRIAQTDRLRRRAMLTMAVRSSPPSP